MITIRQEVGPSVHQLVPRSIWHRYCCRQSTFRGNAQDAAVKARDEKNLSIAAPSSSKIEGDPAVRRCIAENLGSSTCGSDSLQLTSGEKCYVLALG